MDKRRGFTVVELMITIVIMATLLVVGVVSYRGYQSSARDKERESDIAAIQMYLESIYQMEMKDSAGNVVKKAGSYPALLEEKSASDASLVSIFSDLSSEVLSPPGVKGLTAPSWSPSSSTGNSPYLYLPASNSTATKSQCTGGSKICYSRPNSITAAMVGNNYVYAPGPADNQLCTMIYGSGDSSNCRRYTLYYRTEVDGALRKVESKHK